MAMIGWLALSSAEDNATYRAAFRAGLNDVGYVSGQDFVIHERYADGRPDALLDLASDLAKQRLDVIVAAGTEAAVAATQAAPNTPVVFTISGDPLGAGLADSLAHPGSSATGLTSQNPQLTGKRLELLKTALPRVKRVIVIWADGTQQDMLDAQMAADELGLQVSIVPVATEADVQTSLQTALDIEADALAAVSGPVIQAFGADIARFAFQHRLPTISEQRDFVAAGGLMAYGADAVALCRRAAVYVPKIIAGAAAADLPVERPDRFELVLNFQTAQRFNIALPQSLLLQATEVIV
jgi:putative ABC transport system substrate-binding protein